MDFSRLIADLDVDPLQGVSQNIISQNAVGSVSTSEEAPSTSTAAGNFLETYNDQSVMTLTREPAYFYQEKDPYENLIVQAKNDLNKWKKEGDLERLCEGLGEIAELSILHSPIKETPQSAKSIKDKSCPICSARCASMQSLHRHVQRKHPGMEEDLDTKYLQADTARYSHVCELCMKACATPAALQLHKRRVHARDLRFACDKCGKGYPLMSELRKHLKRVHQSNKE